MECAIDSQQEEHGNYVRISPTPNVESGTPFAIVLVATSNGSIQSGPYFADFACVRLKLVIEIDGGQHAEQRVYDAARDQFMKDQGFNVLRFGAMKRFNKLMRWWQ